MFKKLLEKYKERGSFEFNAHELFREKCNAPRNKSGVYLIYKIRNSKEILIYIGSSGQKNKEGKLKNRKGGIYDRLVNGYHPNRFGESKRIKRLRAFPMQMIHQQINTIKIYWWITYNDINQDFPSDVETRVRKKYISTYHRLPEWHN